MLSRTAENQNEETLEFYYFVSKKVNFHVRARKKNTKKEMLWTQQDASSMLTNAFPFLKANQAKNVLSIDLHAWGSSKTHSQHSINNHTREHFLKVTCRRLRKQRRRSVVQSCGTENDTPGSIIFFLVENRIFRNLKRRQCPRASSQRWILAFCNEVQIGQSFPPVGMVLDLRRNAT